MSKVKCPYCGQDFDKKDSEHHIIWERGDEFGLASRRYFHVDCIKLAQTMPKDQWPAVSNKIKDDKNIEIKTYADMIYDYYRRVLKVPANYILIQTQMKSFIKNQFLKPEGIYKTVRYCYDIKHMSKDKINGGIGIVPYVYTEAAEYFVNNYNKRNEFIEGLDNYIKQQTEEVITIKRGKREKKKNYINLTSLEEDND